MLSQDVAKFVAQMKEIAEIFEVEQSEIDLLENNIQRTINQFYIKSADYSLADWENEFGIEINSNMSLAERRGRILAKLNTRTPATIQMIENLVQQTIGINAVNIIEYPNEYRFEIYVNTKDLSKTMYIADEAVYNARPAHLAYKFINGLIRNSQMTEYVGLVGCCIKTMRGTVNIE